GHRRLSAAAWRSSRRSAGRGRRRRWSGGCRRAWEVLSVGTDGSIGADGAGWDGLGGRAGRSQAAGVRAGAGRFAAAAFCGRTRKNQAAPQVPAMIAAKETQPWYLNRLVSTRELPMVQPPASAAPTPMATPPPALRRMVVTSGTRQ